MNTKYRWQECKNCLANYESHEAACPTCGTTSSSSQGARTKFNDHARELISGYGGIYSGIVSIPRTDDVLVCCEVGVFRYNPTGVVIWSSGIAGLLRKVEIVNTSLYVNGRVWSIETGREA